MRRSTQARPTISLARLLESQEMAILKDPRYAELWAMLRDSARLRAAALNKTAFVLINQPRLELRNLGNFLETYRLPAHPPFFELLLTIKWERLSALAARKRDRESRIAAIAEGFPPGVRGLIAYLAAAERRSNPSAPFLKAELRPGTLKRAGEMAAFGPWDWISFFEGYIERLRSGYRRITLLGTDLLIASMILDCAPDPATGRLPSAAFVRSQYKRLSKACHPDLGGDPALFRLISRSRDVVAIGRRG